MAKLQEGIVNLFLSSLGFKEAAALGTAATGIELVFGVLGLVAGIILLYKGIVAFFEK